MLSVTWYAVSMAALVPLLIAYWFLPKAAPRFYSFCRFVFLKYFAYLLAVKRRYWTSVSLLQLVLLLLYFVANGLYLGVAALEGSNLMVLSGMMSSINLVPLFLGGRTNFIMDKLGVPLHVYYLAHHWIGRMAVAQGVLHVMLAVLSGTRRRDINPSGIALIASLFVVLIQSSYSVRRSKFEFFLKFHFLLALTTFAFLLWHLLPGNLYKILCPIIAMTWVLNASLRLLRIGTYNFGNSTRRHQALLTKYYRAKRIPGSLKDGEVGAVKIELQLKRPIALKPGQYVYLNTTDLQFRDRFQAHPFMIAWWDDASSSVGDLPLTGPTKAKSLTFLIQPRNGFTARLCKEYSLEHMLVDGPYGRDLHLERYDTVILVGKGIGIVGILSYAKQLMSWKAHRARRPLVRTRKLDLYWELEENCQENWVGHYLKELQDINQALSTPLLQIWCYFPDKQNSEPCLTLADDVLDYQYFYPDSLTYMRVEDAVKEVSGKALGSGIVVTCGTQKFTQEIRDAVRSKICKENVIEFVEVEYRPSTMNSKSRENHAEDTELRTLKPPGAISGPVQYTTSKTTTKLTKLQKIDEEGQGRVIEASFI